MAAKGATAAAKAPRNALPVIAAVGASAGGLAAFKELLAALPRDLLAAPGLALVFIQHLQPSHPSLLAEILKKSTWLPVEEVRDGTVPEGGQVYVLPAGKTMTFQGGKLRLSKRGDTGEPPAPIDRFMRTLAEERRSAAIGVVLSGTASDGTLGLEAIKAEGGVCFAQTECSTEFPGMARSAIASGCVDFVLTPAEIGRELAPILFI